MGSAQDGGLHPRRAVRPLTEATQSLICVFDREGRILLFNDACERATGFRREEVLGRDAPRPPLPRHVRHRPDRPRAARGGLRDRAETAGGTLTVLSPAGRGTIVTAALPLGAAAL